MVTESKPLPQWIKGSLSHDDLAKVAAAVRQVEVTTNAEIVPMIVRRSTYTSHVPLLTVLLAMILAFAIIDIVDVHGLVAWGGQLLAIALGFLLSRLAVVRRLLTAGADFEDQILRRAELEFFEAGLQKTQDATGILLFISFEEHRAVVLADKTIASKLPPSTWTDVVSLMTSGAKKQRLADGLIAAIEMCGSHVKTHFPIKGDDRNELRDALVIKDD